MNQLVIIGNLTRDPEGRYLPDGTTPVCTFTVAVNRKRKREEADFFRVSTFGKLAELCGASLAKGNKVAVSGAVSARAYLAKDGKPAVSMELNADSVDFLTPRDAAAQMARKTAEFVPVDDEEDPFS